jgi:hypothetical protein
MRMTIHAPHRHRPQLVHPTPSHTKNRHSRHAHNGPPIFTALLVLAVAAALVRLYYILQMPAASSTLLSNCANYLRSFDYTKSVEMEPGDGLGAVESVDALDGGAPATLVQVLHSDTQLSIDVYVFGCAMQRNQLRLTTLFQQRGLVEGSVEVSPARTLVTGTLDPSLSASADVLLLPAQQYVYREYAWAHGAFRQVVFPSLYPVASRAEAEALQQQANNGQSLPWSDPLATAQAMAKDLFQWPAADQGNPADTLISNDGTTALVQLVEPGHHLTVDVTLRRLVQHDSKGLWFVVAAHSQGITLNLNEQASATLPATSTQSPLTLAGTGALVDGQTSATLFDHTLTPITSASSVPIPVGSDGTYSGSFPYITSVAGQQGLLLITSLPQTTASGQGQLLLVSVLLGS